MTHDPVMRCIVLDVGRNLTRTQARAAVLAQAKNLPGRSISGMIYDPETGKAAVL